MHPWTFYALEVSRDRDREARQRRLLIEARAVGASSAGPSRPRRAAALVFAAVSRGSAAAVRRLDDCVADDLGRSLAPTE
jgi:hypothetical protein